MGYAYLAYLSSYVNSGCLVFLLKVGSLLMSKAKRQKTLGKGEGEFSRYRNAVEQKLYQ